MSKVSLWSLQEQQFNDDFPVDRISKYKSDSNPILSQIDFPISQKAERQGREEAKVESEKVKGTSFLLHIIMSSLAGEGSERNPN